MNPLDKYTPFPHRIGKTRADDVHMEDVYDLPPNTAEYRLLDYADFLISRRKVLKRYHLKFVRHYFETRGEVEFDYLEPPVIRSAASVENFSLSSRVGENAGVPNMYMYRAASVYHVRKRHKVITKKWIGNLIRGVMRPELPKRKGRTK